MMLRPYFVFGDLFSNAVVGAVAALALGALVSPGWNMLLVMLVGMALGMVIATPLSLPLSALFGAHEVMVPCMTTGMVAGMVVSMKASMEALPPATAVIWGAGIGVVVAVVLNLLNAVLRGPSKNYETVGS